MNNVGLITQAMWPQNWRELFIARTGADPAQLGITTPEQADQAIRTLQQGKQITMPPMPQTTGPFDFFGSDPWGRWGTRNEGIFPER